jgi:hypothetical protein
MTYLGYTGTAWGTGLWLRRRIREASYSQVCINDTTKILYRKMEKIFPERKLRGLSPSFCIHISVSDLYIPTIGLPIWLQQNRWTDPGNI